MKHSAPLLIIFLFGWFYNCNEGIDKNWEPIDHGNLVYPKIIELDTTLGYAIDQYNGDSLKPLVTAKGDTIATGKTIKLVGNFKSSDSLEPYTHKKVDLLEVSESFKKNTAENRLILEDFFLIDSSVVEIIGAEFDRNKPSLVNVFGDTVFTDKPFKTEGKTINLIESPALTGNPTSYASNANLSIQHITSDQGLNSVSVRKIFKDSRGYIWISQNGSGVCKFDGNQFWNYGPSSGFPSGVVYDIIEDKNGVLWFATWDAGFCRYDGNKMESFTTENGFVSNEYHAVHEDSKGNIWLGGYNTGLIKYSGDQFYIYGPQNGFSGKRIDVIEEDADGNIWIGGRNEVYKYDGKSFIRYNESFGFKSHAYAIHAKKDEVWVGSHLGGVHIIKGDSVRKLTTDHGLPDNRVYDITESSLGDIVLSTFGGGICRINNDRIEVINEENGLSSNGVISGFVNDNNDIWLGTWGGGISIIKDNGIIHQFDESTFKLNDVYAIFDDSKGTEWIGTNNAGLGISTQDSLFVFKGKHGLVTNYIYDIFESDDSTIWMAAPALGVASYKNGKLTLIGKENGLPANTIYGLTEAYDKMWIVGWDAGVNALSEEGVTTYSSELGLSSNLVYDIITANDGSIWVATWGGGICHIENDSLTNYTTREGLRSNQNFTVFEDSKNNIWIGSFGGGLTKFDGTRFMNFSVENGLPSENITSIAEDKNGNIWAASSNGLSMMTPNDNDEFVLNTFSKKDGFKGGSFYANSIKITKRNELLLGSDKCLERVDLERFKPSEKSPLVYLNSININDENIDYKRLKEDSIQIDFSGVKPFTNLPADLILPHYLNHIEFLFSGIDWKAPHKVKFSFRLKGLNDKWSTVSDKTSADFRNIPPGAYEFQIRSIGESGVWSKSFVYAFQILPPWWKTWWAYLIYIISGLLAILFSFQLRTKQLKKRKAELENEVYKATSEIRNQKNIIEQAHREITDSINYAERIQRSFLATDDILNNNLGNFFVYFNPKEAVSGDFYWAGQLQDGNFALCCADSTGHGVPGAIMSILNISSLEKAVEKNLTNPASIFNETRTLISERLKKDGSTDGGKDGMDATLISLDQEKTIMKYVAANNPIWIIRNQSMIEIQSEKMPVGRHELDENPFKGGVFELMPGDMIYLMTDGYQDQFGGEKGKKFKIKRLKDLLMRISGLSPNEQLRTLSEVFLDWKSDNEQIDDVCIIGIQID